MEEIPSKGGLLNSNSFGSLGADILFERRKKRGRRERRKKRRRM